MQTIQRVCRPYIGTRSFYADALKVMIPVTIQQLINNLFNMVDSLMVGSLDINGLAMSAVSVANKPYVIFFGVFFGMTGAAGLMISQYYGANDRKTCQGLFALQMVIGLAISLFFCALL
ncbi:MAG: MATE family efflux transporter, partial [Clostridia bacterium]